MNTVELLTGHVEQNLADRPGALRLDLAELGFMDSSGLRLLIDLYDRSRREDWELSIVRPRNESATMVLRATGADTALPFEPDGSRVMSVSSETQPHDEKSVLELELEQNREAPVAGTRGDRGILGESRPGCGDAGDADAARFGGRHQRRDPPRRGAARRHSAVGADRRGADPRGGHRRGQRIHTPAPRPRKVRPRLRPVSARAPGIRMGRGAPGRATPSGSS